MESLGAIGLARTFYTAGRMGSKLFHEEDPFAKSRSLDDREYAMDHFWKEAGGRAIENFEELFGRAVSRAVIVRLESPVSSHAGSSASSIKLNHDLNSTFQNARGLWQRLGRPAVRALQ